MPDFEWKYSGPIFDAHTHIWNTSFLDETLAELNQLGVKAQLVIAHLKETRDIADQLPGSFVFAKYLPTRDIVSFRINGVVQEIKKMREEGFTLAKMWAAPGWRNYLQNLTSPFSITDPRLEPVFSTLEAEGYPLLFHVADPDTYYATTYANSAIYGTKEEHLNQLETLIEKYSNLTFQIAHFGAQPEIPRLSHLGKWFDQYPNIVVDTASSRWMARELSKDPKKARQFLIRYSKRILFGTDATLNRPPEEQNKGQGTSNQLSPYNRRFLAQRILWETKERKVPLPFPDPDTEAHGGTFINGLNLPKRVLADLYWRNAQRLYGH